MRRAIAMGLVMLGCGGGENVRLPVAHEELTWDAVRVGDVGVQEVELGTVNGDVALATADPGPSFVAELRCAGDDCRAGFRGPVSLVVRFQPTIEGATAGRVRVRQDGRTVVVVELAGHGFVPRLACPPLWVFQRDGVQVFRCTNPTPLGFVADGHLEGGGFSLEVGLPLPVAPLGELVLAVGSRHGLTGRHVGMLGLVAATGEDLEWVPLVGNPVVGDLELSFEEGQGDCQLRWEADRQTFDFGTVMLGESCEAILLLRNLSVDPAMVEDASLDSTSDPAFTLGPPAPFTVPGSEEGSPPVEARLTLRFAPVVAGQSLGQVNLVASTTANPVRTFQIEGRGAEP